MQAASSTGLVLLNDVQTRVRVSGQSLKISELAGTGERGARGEKGEPGVSIPG